MDEHYEARFLVANVLGAISEEIHGAYVFDPQTSLQRSQLSPPERNVTRLLFRRLGFVRHVRCAAR